MSLDIHSITNSPTSIHLLSAIARVVPRGIGHRIADFIAARIASQRRSRLARSLRANQWGCVNGENLSREELDKATLEALRSSARSIFDLYHYLDHLGVAGRHIVLELANAHLLHHRETDPVGSDFRRARQLEEREVIVKRNGGLTKVLWFVVTVLLGVIGFLLVQDRRSIEDNDKELRRLVAGHEAQIVLIRARQDRVLDDLNALRKQNEQLHEQLDANSIKLDRLLAQFKRIQ